MKAFKNSWCLLAVMLAFCTTANTIWAKNKADNKRISVNIALLVQEPPVPATLPILDPYVADAGVPGAELAVQDNNTTGQFTGYQFNLKSIVVPQGGNVTEIFAKSISGKFDFLLTALPAETLLAIADLPAAKNMLVFDVATRDDRLRGSDCRRQVLHVLPSRAMRADALAQFMVKKRWTKWFLVVGDAPEDGLFADALKRSIKHFGIHVVAEKIWEHHHDARRTAQSEVAVFTQLDEDYDVLVVADEQGQFGEYLDYRSWMPRPVIGTQGLVAAAWHPVHEQWGAVQIQNRFKEKTGRWMDETDYGAYLAVRAIGEAVVRSRSAALPAVQAYLLSDKFALQGYKGAALSFRSWDGQLRQPVLLAAPRSLVAVAPIEGFLHPVTELDTLGFDKPETACKQEHQ